MSTSFDPDAAEADRLAALRRYGMLDATEPLFDDVAQVAACLCAVPMAAVVLVDADRQWCLGSFGGIAGGARSRDALTDLTIGRSGVCKIDDVAADRRFSAADVRTHGARFYAGAPITTSDGFVLGMVQVFDPRPRDLSEEQAAGLAGLARIVIQQMERRRLSVALLAVTGMLERLGTLQQVDDLGDAGRSIAALGRDLLGADGAAVLLRDTADEALLRALAVDAQPDVARALSALSFPLGRYTRAGSVMRGGVGSFFTDEADHERSGDPLAGCVGAGSVLYLPIPCDTGGLGVLVGWWRDSVGALDPQVERLAGLLAHDAGRTLVRLRRQLVLAAQAETDELTGLRNRRSMLRALATLRPGASVAMIDLDHFKLLNDTHGHIEGDAALRGFADRLATELRTADMCGRWGGEEFLVVLPDGGVTAATALLDRLRSSLAAAALPAFSAGIATHVRGAVAATTIARADAAVYAAKAAGRGCTVVWTEPVDAALGGYRSG